MGHMGMRTSGATEVSDLLGEEMVATPTIDTTVGRRRRRLELPHSIERERVAFGERAATRYLPLPGNDVLSEAQRLGANLVEMSEILRDRQHASIRLVMNPERMVIKEAQRTFTYLNLY